MAHSYRDNRLEKSRKYRAVGCAIRVVGIFVPRVQASSRARVDCCVIGRLQRLYIAGDLGETSYDQEKAKVVRQLAQLPAGIESSPEIKALLRDVVSIWKAMTDKERQDILNCLFKAIYVRGWKIDRVYARTAFKKLFKDGE